MTENWDEPAPAVELPEIKLFGKWSSDDVQVSDISLTVSLDGVKTYLGMTEILFESFYSLVNVCS